MTHLPDVSPVLVLSDMGMPEAMAPGMGCTRVRPMLSGRTASGVTV